MKNFNFLIGALGGALGGFILSNKKLRKQLSEAKNKKEAAEILGKAIQKSGADFARDTKELIESDDVQKKFTSFKKFANDKWKEVSKEVQKMTKKAGKQVAKKAKKAVKKCRKCCKK